MTTVLVCDHSASEREAIKRTVSAIVGVDRVLTATTGEEAITKVELDRPDIVLLDARISGMGGEAVVTQLGSSHPDIAVVVLTTPTDPEIAGRAAAAGASGYIAKNAGQEEFAALLSLVLAASRATETHRSPPERAPLLSERELQVLEGMSRGLSNAQIGEELFLSEDTIKTHARRLFRKLDAPDRAAAVATGFRWGLLQ